TGKAYLADPARIGPVTGSPLPPFVDSTGAVRDHNIFRIEGPPGSALGGFNADGTSIDFIETTDFTLMGRVNSGTIPGRVTVDRASYTASASAQKLDVFASGFETVAGRLPTQPRPAPVSPVLSFYEAPCGNDLTTGALIAPAGVTDQQMFQAGTSFSAQSQPLSIPSFVCVKDSAARDVNGTAIPAFFQAAVTDEIAVTKALYDYDSQTLTVSAASSDTVNSPALSLDGFGALTAGTISVNPLVASPANVRVRSAAGGFTDMMVSTNYSGAAPGALKALNDTFAFDEDTGAHILSVLANDTNAAGGTVAIVAAPRLGTATANADGTITYTSNANANGADSFTYQVTTAAGKSNIANVALTINPINDPSTAVNDGPFTLVAGKATALPNLLDNDLDADGRADLAAAVQIVAPAGLTVSGGANGLVTVTAATAGTFTFTYNVQDVAGNISANAATVTVNVIPSDTVTITRAQFTIAQKRWVVTGTTSVPNQSINLTYVNGSAAGHSIGTVPVDTLGNWTLDIRNVTGADDPTTLPVRPNVLKATSSFAGAATVNITYK
ncbi:MAG: Ig-like domain-containing protein, partial [Myxococcales bacterium]